MKAEPLKGAPPDSIAACHPSGWIQQDLFTHWMLHFVNHVKHTPENPVVLLLDGHNSHTRNLDVIEIGRKHRDLIIYLLPHSTQTPTFRCLLREPTKDLLSSGNWKLAKEQFLPVSHSLSGSWAYGESLPSCCHNVKRCQWFPKMWDFSM
jgi:hypothetical protein